MIFRRKEVFMAKKMKTSKPAACEICAGADLIRRVATYPVKLTGPLVAQERGHRRGRIEQPVNAAPTDKIML